jgi:AcrR family transcriptional regulator
MQAESARPFTISDMSPRPRLASDAEILMAVLRTIARLGPNALTLADVAEDAGLSAPALIKRFGSKRGLLLAAAADVAAGHLYLFAGLREEHSSPLDALLNIGDCLSVMGTTREQMARTLAFFSLDLTDPEFREHALTGARTFHTGLRALVRDAVGAGELEKCDTGALARALQATIQGALLDWAIQGEGALGAWIKRDLKLVLRGYVT